MVSGQCDPVEGYVAVHVAGQTHEVLVSLLQILLLLLPSDDLKVSKSTVYVTLKIISIP